MKNQNELVKRYLYDVVRRLPETQRKDIEEELETLIEDMLEERADNGKSEEENVQEVLRELGEPSELSAKYRGDKQYLLGGEYYPLYCQILKIVLICVAAGMLIVTAVDSFVQVGTETMSVDGVINVMQDSMINIGAIPSALIQAFGMVTLIFWFMEQNQVKVKEKVSWSVDKLPEIPEKKALLSRGDSIVGIIFNVLVGIMLIYIPELMGAWVKTDSGAMVAIPLFNMEMWNLVLPLFVLSVVGGLADELVKLIKGRYCLSVMWTTIVTSIFSVFVAVKVLPNPLVWNRKFVEEIEMVTGKNLSEVLAQTGLPWLAFENLNQLLMAVIIFACVLEVGITVYRTLRYGINGAKK
ncbi:MAG: hypothetical protein IJ282_00980 [Lachnospiraceae bacterium]|nr:hypothetical protein [Lachnospiraceae bacterium]